ncbi:MAG: metallophosphoesterase [Kiritimatiellae bacterium]|nr:metallophosphoesterase [Kiritimatiellia bacterium]
MKVAVLSDMHVGMGAKAQDLCPLCLVDKDNQVKYIGKQKDYLGRFLTFLEKENLKADYLLIPGDMTESAHPEEVSLASKVLIGIREQLEVPENKVVYVPGNHDVDWGILDPRDSTKTRWRHRYMALNESQFVFDSINKRGIPNGDLLQNNYFNLWEYEDFVVLGYNSASTDKKGEKVHHGDIVIDHVKAMENVLKNMNFYNDRRIKVCLIHHHLRNYPLPTPIDYDPSTANNGECLIDLLLDYNFDLIVHGHRHHSFLDTRKDIPILCAGSFSATIGSYWEGLVFNQFHLIDMTKADLHTKARGVVYSWLNNASGWHRSFMIEDGCIVDYKSPFGLSLKRHQAVSEKLKTFLSKELDCSNVISWKDDVLRGVPELSFASESRDEIINWCRENILDVAIRQTGREDFQFVKR